MRSDCLELVKKSIFLENPLSEKRIEFLNNHQTFKLLFIYPNLETEVVIDIGCHNIAAFHRRDHSPNHYNGYDNNVMSNHNIQFVVYKSGRNSIDELEIQSAYTQIINIIILYTSASCQTYYYIIMSLTARPCSSPPITPKFHRL